MKNKIKENILNRIKFSQDKELSRKTYTILDKNSLDIKKIFSQVPIFSEVYGHKGISMLVENGRLLEFPIGSTIVEEGKTSLTAFVVLEGDIEILRKSMFGDNFVVATLQVNETSQKYPFIGEQSLISKSPRTATVRALSPVRMLQLHHDAFIKTADAFPEIGIHIYKAICTILQERLSRAHNNVVTLFEAYMDTMKEDLMENKNVSQDIRY